MVITRVSVCLSSLLLAVFLLSCADHLVPIATPGATAARLRVKTITQDLPDNKTWVSQLSYDPQGRLASILAFQTPDSSVARVERTAYQYDTQNRLTQAQRSIVTRQSFNPLDGELYTYTYNSNGQVSSLRQSSSTVVVTPNYSSDNKPTTYGRSISVSGLTSSGGGGSFTFTSGNLTKSTERLSVFRSGGGPSPDFGYSVEKSFTYDAKLNPFYGVFVIPAPGAGPAGFYSGSYNPYYTYFGGIDNTLNLSLNNVLTEVTSTGVSSSYQYQYNAANLPVTRTTVTNGTTTETLRFTYEAY